MQATYSKLKDGTWGVRVEFSGKGSISAGDRVVVKKKSGEKKEEVIDRVLWKGNGIFLCSIKDAKPASGESRAMCMECGVRPGTIQCSDSSGISGLCCSRCAGGSPWERSFA